jgi:hypothetical protein
MFKIKFKEFKQQNFLDFVLELINLYGMGEIRFYPKQGLQLFDKFQLEHIAPGEGWDINHPKGFLYVWNKNINIVRVVSFELFRKIGTPKIKMTINLDKRTIILDEIQGIEAELIKNSLEKFIPGETIISSENSINKWWKYTHPIWWIWILGEWLFRDLIWRLLTFVWKHKLITGIILLIIIPIIVGLCINYLTFKFGWK